jgi:hypothetical protein
MAAYIGNLEPIKQNKEAIIEYKSDNTNFLSSDKKINYNMKVPSVEADRASRELSRLTLNNPSSEIKQLIRKILINLGKLIDHFQLDSEDINFLLESVPDARSAFSWKYTPTNEKRIEKINELIYQLKNFDLVEDFDENFFQYAADLDTLMTAIAYRGIGPSWIKNTIKSSDRIQSFIKAFVDSGYLIEAIDEKQFPNRYNDNASHGCHDVVIRIISKKQDQVEKAELSKELSGLPPRIYRLNSYVTKALSEGVPMRAHVSGSVSLTLAALYFVLNLGKPKKEPNEADLIKLAGILCACYEIGDFHSFAETSAGIAHFYQMYVDKMSFSNANVKILEQINPSNFLALSIGFLNSSIDERSLDQFTIISQMILDSCTTC